MSFGEKFLQYPDLFPNRHSGESWGDRSLVIDFVGGPYLFRGLGAAQVEACRERFGELCKEPEEVGPPSLESRVFQVSGREFRSFDMNGWTYTFDRDYTADSVRLAGFDFVGRLDWTPQLNCALWSSEEGGPPFQCLFENFFRVVVAYRLLELGGALLHSACAVSQGKAYLFLGQSGAGKSTISRLSLDSGRRVLSDDMNALCPHEGQTWVEKLPFAGDLGRTPTPRSAYPLRSLSRLRQGADQLRPLPPAQAVATLIACAPFVNSDPHRLDRLVANLQALVASLPAQELTFSLDGPFWELLEAAAESSEAGRALTP